MIRKLVLVAVSAMLVLNVSAREVRKSKCRGKQVVKKEQRIVFLRPARPMPCDIRFEDARRMKRIEVVRRDDPRFRDHRSAIGRRGMRRHPRHQGRR